MSEAYRICGPDLSDPASIGYPVEVGTARSLSSALEKAKDHAKLLKRAGTVVTVEKADSNEAWSVQYHPEAPVPGGEPDEYGAPGWTWPVEFRIVQDATEVEQIRRSTEEGTEEVELGGLVGERKIIDVMPDGTEVDRADLAP